MFENMKNMS